MQLSILEKVFNYDGSFNINSLRPGKSTMTMVLWLTLMVRKSCVHNMRVGQPSFDTLAMAVGRLEHQYISLIWIILLT